MNRTIRIMNWTGWLVAAMLTLGCSQPPDHTAAPSAAKSGAETTAASAAPSPNPKTTAGAPGVEDDIDKLIKQLQGTDPGAVTGPGEASGPGGADGSALIKKRGGDLALLENQAPEVPPTLKGPGESAPAKVKVPPYFNELGLTEEQKDKIRRIAGAFDPVIKDLQEQLSLARQRPFGRTTEILSLTLVIKKRMNQRQKAMEDVLTDEQRDKLKELRKTSGALDEKRPRPPRFKSLNRPATGESEKVMEGLTQEEVDKAVKEYADTEWHPTDIKGYPKGTKSQFDITWRSSKNSGRWYLYSDMSAEGFAQRKEELAKDGFKVNVQSRWQVDGEERFAAIWYQVW
jgi:Spy/CpxP family protein refolding chaperone